MLRFGAGGLLAAGLWPGALRAEGAGGMGAFHFLVVNDLHYIDQRDGRWLERVIRQMKAHAEQPEFCLVVGDLAENGKPTELGPVRDLLKTLGIPAYAVIGNHDY